MKSFLKILHEVFPHILNNKQHPEPQPSLSENADGALSPNHSLLTKKQPEDGNKLVAANIPVSVCVSLTGVW